MKRILLPLLLIGFAFIFTQSVLAACGTTNNSCDSSAGSSACCSTNDKCVNTQNNLNPNYQCKPLTVGTGAECGDSAYGATCSNPNDVCKVTSTSMYNQSTWTCVTVSSSQCAGPSTKCGGSANGVDCCNPSNYQCVNTGNNLNINYVCEPKSVGTGAQCGNSAYGATCSDPNDTCQITSTDPTTNQSTWTCIVKPQCAKTDGLCGDSNHGATCCSTSDTCQVVGASTVASKTWECKPKPACANGGEYCGDSANGATCCDPNQVCAGDGGVPIQEFDCQPNFALTPTPAPPPPPCLTNPQGNCIAVATGLGNVAIAPAGVIGSVFGILLSFAGGIVLIIIIFSGYRLMRSQGDPEKLKGAREMLTAAIIGLLFIIFSVTILEIIGVNILHLPGFAPGATTLYGGGGGGGHITSH